MTLARSLLHTEKRVRGRMCHGGRVMNRHLPIVAALGSLSLLTLVALAPAALCQGTEVKANRHADEWLSALGVCWQDNRASLERADRRSQKLFGNAEFLSDIDEHVPVWQGDSNVSVSASLPTSSRPATAPDTKPSSRPSSQGGGEQPSPAPDWLGALIDSCAPHRDALVAADPRNGKLFRNRDVLADIDEKDRFATEKGYRMTAGAASSWIQRQFPILEGAFSADQVETCANITTGMIYLRGRAPHVDFAAAVPVSDVTEGRTTGRPWTITFVRRRREPEAEADLRKASEQHGSEQAQLWTRYLSGFGDVLVEKVESGPTDTAPTQPVCVHVDAQGAFRTLGMTGRLRIAATPMILRLELSGIRPPGLRLPKPFMPVLRAGPERDPDWLGISNARVSVTGPETNKAGG